MPQTISDDHYYYVRNMDIIDMANSRQVTIVRLPLHSTLNFEHWARLSWVHWKPIIARKFAYAYSNLTSCDTLHHHGAAWESLIQSADVRNCSERLQMYADLAAHKKRCQWSWVHCHWNWWCKNMQYIIFWNSIISTDFPKSAPRTQSLPSSDDMVASLSIRLAEPIWHLFSSNCFPRKRPFAIASSQKHVLWRVILQQRVDSILVKISTKQN